MVDPISNQVFSHDYQKYVYQEQDMLIPRKVLVPKKPFSIDKLEKTKDKKKAEKDQEKKENQ